MATAPRTSTRYSAPGTPGPSSSFEQLPELGVDHREARLRVDATVQLAGRINDEDLRRRANLSLDQVARDRRAVAAREHAMHVEMGVSLSPLGARDPPVQGRDLDLLLDRDVNVVPSRGIEVREPRRRERADRREL